MFTFGYDFGYYREALNNLEPYLLSEASQWPLSGHPRGNPPYPPLTIEGLLLVRQRCLAADLPTDRIAEFEQVESSLNEIIHRWRSSWGKKASSGFSHRLHLWGQYIQELNDEPSHHQDRYSHEIRLRVMLELLQPYADSISPEMLSQLSQFDLNLRVSFQPGEFIWSPELIKAFPELTYWYLYGLPVAKKAVHENPDR